MKTIVITGSTRGIGHGMAENFIKRGHQVIISGRDQADVDRVVSEFNQNYAGELAFGQVCDVTDFEQVQLLWEAGQAHFGDIDIWISNAGQANTVMDFWESPPDLIESVVGANVLGQMFSAKIAISLMLEQGHGALYIMEGKGARGDILPGMTLYSATKRCGNYLFNALRVELKGKPVIVGSLNPGMVVTDLLTKQRELDPEKWEKNKKIFNILAERVEVVTPFLVEKILANTRHGAKIRYGGRLKLVWRFMTAGISKRDVLGEAG